MKMDSFGLTGSGEGGSSALSSLNGQMGQLNAATAQFGKVLATSLTQGISKGKSFEDILGNIGQKFRTMALNNANSAIEGGINTLFSGLLGGLGGLGGGGIGGGLMGIIPQGFASGGVINAPSYFPMGRGLGLMGERGAEAIMPLARGPDGRLGVATHGRGSGAMNITMMVSTPDAESFRRSEAQVSAALARAVSRGQRSL
jgi:phage-related minor tail protein